MTKAVFLKSIEDKISRLPRKDVDSHIDYYTEMIEDYIEDGLTEEEAVGKMGDIDVIVTQILKEVEPEKPIDISEKKKRRLGALEITLLILGSPIWLSLLAAALIIIFAVFIVIWSVVISLYAIDVMLVAIGLYAIVGSPLMLIGGDMKNMVLYLGIGLICVGMAILLFLLSNAVAGVMVDLSKKIIKWVKSWFVRKEVA